MEYIALVVALIYVIDMIQRGILSIGQFIIDFQTAVKPSLNQAGFV